MKKILFIFFIAFSIYVIPKLYFIDKVYFLCPIEYKNSVLIRNDKLGKGTFGESRLGGRRHTGVDLYAQIGAPVRAACSGRVLEAGFHNKLGNYIELIHFSNLTTVYGHLQEGLVQPGQLIAQGEVIGYAGKTGNASYSEMLPHLHFKLEKNHVAVDPLPWIEGRVDSSKD